MAGSRILDAARIAQAASNVVKQHIALRSQQLDVYNKTSGLARAAKEQTDRVTLTVQAAAVLAQRLAESQVRQQGFEESSSKQYDIDIQARPRTNQTSQNGNVPVKPSNESAPSSHGQTTDRDISAQLSGAPTQSIPQHSQGNSVSPGDVKSAGINAENFPLPETIKPTATQKEDIPDGIDINVFRTKKGSSLLDKSKLNQLDQKSKSDVKETTFSKPAEHASIPSMPVDTAPITPDTSTSTFHMRESRVPSTRIGRLWQYGGLGMSMAFGAVGETFRRATGGGTDGTSILLSPGNLEKLVARLSRMRGAALKLGQMISFQDIKLLPAPIQEVLQRVQDSADYMPASQRDRVLANNLGSDWRDLFAEFGEVPVAAASIGQVHKAVYRPTGQTVAVKVQYPGVAASIDSDLNNLSILLTASKLLPKGLFLDKTIANARTELAWECDYIREAECATRFKNLLADDTNTFKVPAVIQEASGKEVLTAEFMEGIGVTKLPQLTQSERDWIGTNILRLCLREICEFKFMQTDPNWTNFLFNEVEQKIELLDFGASRDYPDEFIDPYIGVLQAASRNDRQVVHDLSVQLGYLTGSESKAMANAHIDSVLTLAEPFGEQAPEIYDFRDQTITDRVRGLIPVMLKERMAPPPEETYSLHRKLSGAFLLCARLGSRVSCREMFRDAMEKYNKR